MEDTISLETLWAIFSKLKKTHYNESLELKKDMFTATPEMIFNALLKELHAQSKISVN